MFRRPTNSNIVYNKCRYELPLKDDPIVCVFILFNDGTNLIS